MKCVLPAINVKLFGKAIHCLAKIGTEIYFEPLENGLALKTVNSSRSSYVCFLFLQSMFEEYEPLNSQCSTVEDDDENNFKCKVAVKTILQVFKSLSTIEKSVEKCIIHLDDIECRLVFQLKCRHAITKTHRLTFEECDSLQAKFAKDLCPNALKCDHKVLADTAVNFASVLEEISLSVTPCAVVLRSVSNNDENTPAMKTEMILNPAEFSEFQVGVDTEVQFCLKDMRAVLAFCDVAACPVQLHFEAGGKPLIVSVQDAGLFRAHFVLATIAADISVSDPPPQPPQRRDPPPPPRPRGASCGRPTPDAKRRKPQPRANISAAASRRVAEEDDDLAEAGSPEIPDQNCADEQPSYKRVRKAFFASQMSQSCLDRTDVILAPDSDDDT